MAVWNKWRLSILQALALSVLLFTAISALVYIGFTDNTREHISIDIHDTMHREAASATGREQAPDILRIAVAAMISPETTKRYYEELLTLISGQCGMRTLFTQKKTYAEINDMVEQREVDVAFVCSGPYVAGREKFGMEILAVPVVDGKSVYHSYIIVNKESPQGSLADLRGRTFAFTDPGSNTGYLVPQYMLSRMSETASTFFSHTFYTHSHDNSIRAVAERISDGAAVDHLIWEFMNVNDPAYTRKTKIVEKSPPYGMPPVVVHPDLDPRIKRSLQGVFLPLHQQEKAKPILRRLRIDRFEKGNDAMYDSVREMRKWMATANLQKE